MNNEINFDVEKLKEAFNEDTTTVENKKFNTLESSDNLINFDVEKLKEAFNKDQTFTQSNKLKSLFPNDTDRFDSFFVEGAKQFNNVTPEHLKTLMKIESSFRDDIGSGKVKSKPRKGEPA